MSNTDEKKTTPKKPFIGKGIYGSKDVPIRLLDGLIGIVIVLIVLMIVVFAVNGGYYVSFDTLGGNEIEAQKLRYGSLVEEPETPLRPGYDFVCWVTAVDESRAVEWNFSRNTIEGDITLYAVWTASKITVKFDTDGGTVAGETQPEDKTVLFGEPYGELPIPEKDGYRFDGWVYGGNIITDDTLVSTSGEHILTARWVPE